MKTNADVVVVRGEKEGGFTEENKTLNKTYLP